MFHAYQYFILGMYYIYIYIYLGSVHIKWVDLDMIWPMYIIFISIPYNILHIHEQIVFQCYTETQISLFNFSILFLVKIPLSSSTSRSPCLPSAPRCQSALTFQKPLQ